MAEYFWLGRLAPLDKKTDKVTSYSIPTKDTTIHTRTTYVAVGPNVTVWISDTEDRMMYILNPVTGKKVEYPTYPGWKWDFAWGAQISLRIARVIKLEGRLEGEDWEHYHSLRDWLLQLRSRGSGVRISPGAPFLISHCLKCQVEWLPVSGIDTYSVDKAVRKYDSKQFGFFVEFCLRYRK